MNICVFGDSVAKGVIYDDVKKKYIFLKENFVSILQSNTDVNFKNFAKFGCTTTKGFEIIEKHISNLSEYNYTLLEFGGNDCDLNWSEVAKTPACPHPAQVPLAKFKQQYIEIIENTRKAGSNPILLTLPPLDSERFFNWISKGLDRNKILEYLNNDVNYIFRWHAKYNEMVFCLSKEYNVPVIDIRKEFLTTKNYKTLLCVDGMHPNKEGHKVIANALARIIPALN